MLYIAPNTYQKYKHICFDIRVMSKAVHLYIYAIKLQH